MAELRALSALARHLLPALGKENASRTRVQGAAWALGPAAYDV